MEGIIFLLLVAILILVIILMNRTSTIDKKINDINRRMIGGFDELKDKKTSDYKSSVETVVPPLAAPQKPKEEAPKPVQPPIMEKKPEPIRPVIPPTQKPKVEQPKAIKSVTQNISVVEQKKPVKPPKPKKPSFMERNPDLERFIGENLLSKIGIVIFVIGMGFLVKLGIDSGVITEPMRVGIGVLCGGALIGLAHYLRKSFASFSSVLIGGGLAVLYFTIGLAFHDYSLLPQTAAFVIMVFITAFGVLLAVSYDRKELAVLAIIGGFGTPFFVSTGEGNFRVLFTYILILDIGMLSLVYFKKWNIINYLSYGFTYLLFFGVYVTKYLQMPEMQEANRFALLLFLTAFYLIFFLMTIIYNVAKGEKFKFPEMGMLLTNSAIFFGLGLGLLHSFKSGLYDGIFTASIAIFNIVFVFFLYKRKNIDTNLLYMLVGLVLTFVSLIAPIQLKGNYITLFWAIEAVLLLWMAQKSEIKLMKLASVLINVLMLISLFMDWQKYYFPIGEYIVLKVVINRVFITTAVVVVSLLGSNLLFRNEKTELFYSDYKVKWYQNFIQATLIVILFFGLGIELNYQFLRAEMINDKRFLLMGIYNFIYFGGVIVLSELKKSERLQRFVFMLSIPVLFSYLSFYQIISLNARNLHLQGQSTGFFLHYILMVLFLALLGFTYFKIYKKHSFKSSYGNTSMYILSLVVLVFASMEAGHISVMMKYFDGAIINKLSQSTIKTVYPVVWGIIAFLLMVFGMRHKLKTLRISSLIIFFLTIAKLFLWDLKGNSTARIVSLTVLGAILLVISFLYQKLKFIIQDDEDIKK